MTLATQQSLPAPPPASTGRDKQRVFTTPTVAKSKMADIVVVEDDESDEESDEESEDESDGFEPPPTPTPASRTRKKVNGAKTRAIAKSPTKLATAQTPTAAGQRRNCITNYFGVAKCHSSPDKDSSKGDGKKAEIADPQTPRKAKSTVSRMSRHESIDYSDSEFDSEMERAIVALADHSERKARRHIEIGNTEAGTLNSKAVDDGEGMAMLVDSTGESRRDIIVPVSVDDEYRLGKDSACRTDRQLAAGSGEEAMAADAAADSSKAGSGTISPFAFLPKIPSANQLATSFVSSISSSQPTTQTASSQVLTQDSQSTIATTTPPSSFRSDAGIQFAKNFHNKYGDDGEDSEDDDDGDSFTSMSYKRAPSWEEDEEEESSAPTFMRGWSMESMTYPVPSGMDRGSTAEGKHKEEFGAQSPYWPAAERMYVEEEEGEEDHDQETPIPPPQPSHGSHLTQSNPPKDHNVTLEVLQLLSGQPVEPRVLQQIRMLLNGAFDDMYEL